MAVEKKCRMGYNFSIRKKFMEENTMGLPDTWEMSLDHKYRKGARNLISDVPGVTVGHVTKKDSKRDIHTGVTAVLPHPGNLFREKLPAGAVVLNGFGKSTGLIQVEELGTIETPIILTNTLSTGTALTALTKYMLEQNPEIGVSTGTVNGVVMECNDGSLNDIRGMHVTEQDVWDALAHCSADFEEGDVGSGTGMICMGLKGGIGSASRILSFAGKEYVIGALLMTNFGMRGNLRIDGVPMKQTAVPPEPQHAEQGSVIILLATDLPLSDRQLKRVARRAAAALGRTGSYMGNGSGDIALAFSTANRQEHFGSDVIYPVQAFRDDAIDPVFEAAVEAVEESVISSLYHAGTVTGIRGKTVYGLREYL